MRLLTIIHEFPPIGGGGGAAARDICLGLARRGHEIKVLTSHMPDLPRSEQRDGIEIQRLPSLRRQAFAASLLDMAAFDLSALLAGGRLIKHFQPDVLHAHFAVPAGALTYALARLHKIPYVLTAHLGDVPGGVPEKTNKWFRFIGPFTQPIWRNAARVVAVSEFTRALALQKYNVPIAVIPNGVDAASLRPTRITVGVVPRIIFAGRFVEQKNPLGLVRVLSQLKDLRWECVMLGNGALFKATRDEIKRLGLEARFTLPGWVKPAEVLTEFARSDILFMPSKSEGLPVVGVQALACGLALVVSRAGGFVDLVESGRNGALHNWDAADDMTASLRALLSDRAALESARTQSLQIAQRFDIEQVVDAYEKLFAELYAKGIQK